VRVGIPPNVAMPGGMSVQAHKIWIAMQRYGAFVIDTQGAAQPIEWWCDINSVSNADVNAALNVPSYHGLNQIVSNLRLVR